MRKTKNNISGACSICKSQNTREIHPSNIDLSKLSFTYEFTPDSQKTFRIVRCNNCSHVFCFPLPKNIYKNYRNVIDKKYLLQSKTRKLTAKSVLNIIRKYIPSGKILDVGCATGDFLEIARDYGYSVEGLELSKWSSEIVKNKGIPVHRKLLESLSLKFPERYDVITLFGVIEHFQNPRDEMIYINRLLKPGGILVVWTGDVDGIMSKVLGRRWWYWQGQHIQYFTKSSLNYLAKLCGFEYLDTKIYPIAATYEQVKNSFNRYKFKRYLMPIINIIFTIKPIWYLFLPGEMLWFGRKSLKK